MGDFEEGWHQKWIERKFADLPTLYKVSTEDSNSVLMATSAKSASALWRMLEIHAGNIGKIAWRWKVESSLSKKTQEKTKIGDDYAARVFVVFGPHYKSWKTRAICYVWAAKEPVGSVYRNPYTNSVATVVVESGNEHKDQWISEKRNFIDDYKNFFRGAPEMVTAVAIMVDTENTGQKATAWFDDLVLEVGNIEQEQPDTKPRRIIFNN
ncbi:MAG: DUF3047 domain-containing protein [bacterium]